MARKNKKGKRKVCAFCLRSATMSGEHLWSAWIERLFTEYKGMYSFHTLDADDKIRRWKSRSIDMKAHVVCAQCNSTWMSDVDQDAQQTMKDMIRWAAWVSLLPRGIQSIAAFAFKTAVVADHVRPQHGKPFFSPVERRRFATTRQIPEGVQIWLGVFRGKNLLSGRYTTHYAKIHGGTFRGFELYVFTYVAGFLALQLTAFRWASVAKKPRGVWPGLTQHADWNKRSIPLWPNDGTWVLWPPIEELDDDSLMDFAERWARLMERV